MSKAEEKTLAQDMLMAAIGGCSCDEAYTKRNLTAPDCFWCNESDMVIEAMEAYALACLEKAAENATVKDIYQYDELVGRSIYCSTEVDKESITTKENLV